MKVVHRKESRAALAALFAIALSVMVGCTATPGGAASSASTSSDSVEASQASAASAQSEQAPQQNPAPSSAASSASASSSTSGVSGKSDSDEPIEVIAPYGQPYDEWPEECIDSYGNPTLYAVLNLEGWQFETMLVHLDCTFEGADVGWRNEAGLKFGVVGPEGTLDDSDIAQLHKVGTQVPSIYILSVPGYGSARDLLNACNVVVEDSYYLPDGSAIAVVHGLNRVRAFVVVYQSNGQFTYLIATQSAMTSGLFAELIDSKVVEGASITETWELLTGSHIGERS